MNNLHIIVQIRLIIKFK